MKKYFPINIFTEKHRWWCPLKYSCRFEGLGYECFQFYLKVAQSLIRSCKFCEVLQRFSFTEHYLLLGNCFWFSEIFFTHHFLYQQYIINSAKTSCLGTPKTCMQVTHVSNSENVQRKSEKNQVESNILGLRSTQRTKGYLVEAVAQRCFMKKVSWNIWQN